MARYDVITFDCYGTLIDWESGIAGAFLSAAAADGVTLTREEILSAYAAIEPVVEAERYRSYREILGETATRVAKQFNWPLPVEHAGFLGASLPSWKPFADTNPALEQLVAMGCTLGILSNIDDDLLARTREHFTVPFKVIVTAQQVRSYKPGYAHFQIARRTIGNTRWLHAAESNFHDIVPTNALGIDNAWINRLGQRPRPGGTPTYALDDLAGLVDVVT
jgi:2-haloalkanoic acid dehalogenase type II